MTGRAYCHKAIFSKTLAWVFFWCLFMYRNGTKNCDRCRRWCIPPTGVQVKGGLGPIGPDMEKL